MLGKDMRYGVNSQRSQIPASYSGSLEKNIPIGRQVPDKMTVVDKTDPDPLLEFVWAPGTFLRVDCIPHEGEKGVVPQARYL